jgi:hypothetical protein
MDACWCDEVAEGLNHFSGSQSAVKTGCGCFDDKSCPAVNMTPPYKTQGLLFSSALA